MHSRIPPTVDSVVVFNLYPLMLQLAILAQPGEFYPTPPLSQSLKETVQGLGGGVISRRTSVRRVIKFLQGGLQSYTNPPSHSKLPYGQEWGTAFMVSAWNNEEPLSQRPPYLAAILLSTFKVLLLFYHKTAAMSGRAMFTSLPKSMSN